MASFHVNCLRDSDLLLPRDARYVVTEPTSQVWEYLGLGGRLLNIPLLEAERLTGFDPQEGHSVWRERWRSLSTLH